MTTNSLQILQSGVVGVEPRILFLDTTAQEAEVFTAGFINSIQSSTDIKVEKGDFILIRYDNGLLQQMATPTIDDEGIITLVPGTGDVGISGPITGGLNIGSGSEVFDDVSGSTMVFRTLTAGDNITLTQNSDNIEIAADNSGGTITDGVNIGAGEGIFATVSGADMQFKTVVAGANITLDSDSSTVTINATSSGGGTITDGTNLGAGTGVFASASGSDLQFKSLVSGNNMNITTDANTITLSANAAGGGDITDGQNLGSGTHVFAQKSGTLLQFKTLEAGSGISLTNDSGTVTIASSGGGGGNFGYTQTIFVGKGGNNANDGHSINNPKLTIQNAVSALSSGGVIYVIDNQTYTEDIVFISGQNYTIEAQAATLAAAAGPHFTYSNGSEIVINANDISSSFKEIINGSNGSQMTLTGNHVFGNITNTVTLEFNVNEFGGNITNSGIQTINAISIAGSVSNSARSSITFNSITGNVVDTSASNVIPQCGLFGNLISGDVSSTNTNIYGQVSRITGSYSGIRFGSFGPSETSVPFGTQNGILVGGGVEISDSSIKGEILNISPILNGTSDYTISSQDANNVIGIYSASNNIFINLPDYDTDPDIPVGFKCYVMQVHAGSGRILTMGSDIYRSSDSNKEWTQGRGAFVQIELMVKASAGNSFQNIWGATGDLAGSAFNEYAGPNFYVTKLSGDDTNGNGAITAPFASIGAAVTAIGTPTNRVNIVIIDDETYDEAVVITSGNINIVGPQATINCSTADSLTITTTSGLNQINLNALKNSSGGNALNQSSSGTVYLNLNNASQPIVQENGTLFISCTDLTSDLTVSGVGTIIYQAAFASGVNTAGSGNIKGISSLSVYGNFSVLGTLSINNLYTFPTVDGTSGQVITTDGSGTASWQDASSGGISWSGVSGTSQAAAVNNGYVIQNSSQTTVTLPATAALGSIVSVQGLGSGGFALAANTGQTIQVGAVATSSGGSITSSNQWDSISVVCVVADTTWAMVSSVTSGFIIS